jgi:U3 small nucleolar ribonucleoprotein component
VIKQRI